jgi:hypothetical protein
MVSKLERHVARPTEVSSYVPSRLDQFIGRAQEVWISGDTLASLPDSYSAFLIDKARSGCRFRALITDPQKRINSQVISEIGRRQGVTSKRIRQQILATVNLFRLMNNASPLPGSVRLFGFAHFQPFSLAIVDPNEQNGVARVAVHFRRSISALDPVLDFRAYIAEEYPHFQTALSNFDEMVKTAADVAL